jgi:hypothetical protein
MVISANPIKKEGITTWKTAGLTIQYSGFSYDLMVSLTIHQVFAVTLPNVSSRKKVTI